MFDIWTLRSIPDSLFVLTLKQSARTLASTSAWTLFRHKNLYCNLTQIFIWLPFPVFRGMASEPWSSLGPTWVARALTSDRLLWWQSWHSWDLLFLPERHQWALSMAYMSGNFPLPKTTFLVADKQWVRKANCSCKRPHYEHNADHFLW